MNKKIAFFIDGGYFINRVRYFHRKYFQTPLTAEVVVSVLQKLVQKHKSHLGREDLYRVYYYDARPFDEQMREPVNRTGNTSLHTKNFKKDDNVIFQKELHSSLENSRKLALRMGKLSSVKRWRFNDDIQKELLNGNMALSDLLPEHFHLELSQKGVDTRLGIDITTITLRKFVDTIVLVASDADFVPAAKLARTHGVDVNLDPLHGSVDNELCLHIDGKKSFDIVSLLSLFLGETPNPRPNWWRPNEEATQ